MAQLVEEVLLWHTEALGRLHSRKLTWKPKKGPMKTTVLLKGGYMGFHVSLGECTELERNMEMTWKVGGM